MSRNRHKQTGPQPGDGALPPDGGVATLEPAAEEPESLSPPEVQAPAPAAADFRFGPWSVYCEGLIRKEVWAHTRDEAIQTYKTSLGLRRADLEFDARRTD